MKAEFKLAKIADVWNNFIWEYKFCSRKIKFDDDVKTNYFGDILGYFSDTFEIVFSEKREFKNYSDKFSFTISFLQAIYVQQDFIQELLEIFKTGKNKGHLKEDENYFINREIRNELIGHPIRKTGISTDKLISSSCDYCDNTISKPKKKYTLLSSTLFSYQSRNDEIQYLRYHRDNNFEYESKKFNISEIQKRHSAFLNKYFDLILEKLKTVLIDYSTELTKVEIVIEKNKFDTVLNLVQLYFEAFFDSDYIYKKESLEDIFKKKEEHYRYQNLIDRFYDDLKKSLKETKSSIEDIFKRKTINKFEILNKSAIKIKFIAPQTTNLIKEKRKETYHYELGKLYAKRNLRDFDFFSRFLISKCQNNDLVISELEHMRKNIFNEIEYYTALRLISKTLKEE
jgi:hypothetical protein